MNLELDLQLPGGPMAASYARTLVAGLREFLPQRVLEDLRLLVSELVTNCVRHGLAEGDCDVRLRIVSTGTGVRFEVSDPGPGFDQSGPPSLTEEQTSGWGLYLVDRLSDRWGVNKGQANTVWFEIDQPHTKRASVAS